jgi:hypothetical protein
MCWFLSYVMFLSYLSSFMPFDSLDDCNTMNLCEKIIFLSKSYVHLCFVRFKCRLFQKQHFKDGL